MFTGIIQELGTVVDLRPLSITIGQTEDIAIGNSIAVDGVCLTVISKNVNTLCFDLSAETKAITTLGSCSKGSIVNIERAARLGDFLGGHFVSGHIGAMCTLLEKGSLWRFSCPAIAYPYLFYKGFITLNGVSLTIAHLTTDAFQIAFIPETLRQTTFGSMEIGSAVNLEWDSLTQAAVDTVHRFLKTQNTIRHPLS